ncbi:SpoIIE family protein phosphatase [Streptomyces sp. J2-1]|uniref:ATP-binding SpoIIE family protein phosphatase n=1 Tax=Streptomyces corallincola TaxID=2851888 RepID=UPI001C385185|nr:SpoIIE family protein phosphatase [Streptomyces corallincola]MBV2353962.1 SpoIIE family protein phosphatase [Streptomyces corallincola]
MASGAVLVRITGDGRIVEWSARAEALLGRSRSEAEGRTVPELLDGAPELAGALGAVSVRPVLSGAELTWEVREGRDAGAARRDQAVLRTLFTHAPMALYVLDRELRVLYSRDGVRDAAPSAAAPGAPDLPATLGLEDPVAERAVAGGVLDTGEPVLQRLVRAAPAGGTGRPVDLSLSYVRLQGPDGEVLGLIASALDVTDRERALHRLRVLETVRTTVGTRLEVTAVCRELADAVVPAFTGIVVVEVIDDVIRGEEPPLAPVDHEVPLRRAAFKGVLSAHAVGDVRRLPDGTPFSRVLQDLRPRLVPVTEDSAWLSADPARANSITVSGAHSLIVAPLTVRGQALGVVSFYRHRAEEPFDEDDIALASDVCAHAALCIDNARRFTRERTIAATVKRRLLPQRPSVPATLDVAQMHITGPGGGGAWFDVIELAGGRTLLVLGDVTGRGVATATTMGQLRTVIHALAGLDLEPDELMARLSDTAVRLAAERTRLPSGDPLNRQPLTAGCLIAVYDAVDHTCTLVRAGLSEPFLVLPGGDGAAVPAPGGPVLAGPDQAPFPETAFPMPAGSLLAVGNEDLLRGEPGLRVLLRDGADAPLPVLADDLSYELRDRHDTEKLILLARARGLPAERVLTLPLAEDLSAVPAARTAARARLGEWGVAPDAAFTAELIVSELVANAVRYGAPPFRLRLILDERLTCEVRDAGTSVPHLKHARQVDEDGRGLFIIASVADSWGIRYHPHGKTVWTRQNTGGPPVTGGPPQNH